MKPMHRLLCSCTVLVLAACASSSDPAPEPAPPPAAEESAGPPLASAAPAATGAMFSDEQADRGRDAFRVQCTECHFSGEFSDSQFKFKWSRRSAGDLYDLIQTSMPETAPGSLTPDETVDLVSYIMRMNGFEPGQGELPADPAVLDEISFSSIRRP